MEVHELTAIQRDLLFVVRGLNASSGRTIRSELEETQGRDLLAGRVYANLNELVEQGYVEKRKTGRTNAYSLTEEGREAVRDRRRWERRYLKQSG